MKELRGKLTLITGGSSGIGLSLACRLARLGMRVAILSRRSEALNAASEIIEKVAGERVVTISADTANWEDIRQKLGTFQQDYGTPDLLINSAGVVRPGLFQELEVDLFHWMININLLGPMHVCKALIDGMLARGSGHIVNISSVAGFLGTYGYSAYGASKFGLRGFSDVLRSELRSRGIQVSVVFPPDTDTPQLAEEAPYKPAVTRILSASASIKSPDEVARVIVQGILRNKYLIIPGFEGKLMYFLNNLPFQTGYRLMDIIVAYAIKKSRGMD